MSLTTQGTMDSNEWMQKKNINGRKLIDMKLRGNQRVV